MPQSGPVKCRQPRTPQELHHNGCTIRVAETSMQLGVGCLSNSGTQSILGREFVHGPLVTFELQLEPYFEWFRSLRHAEYYGCAKPGDVSRRHAELTIQAGDRGRTHVHKHDSHGGKGRGVSFGPSPRACSSVRRCLNPRCVISSLLTGAAPQQSRFFRTVTERGRSSVCTTRQPYSCVVSAASRRRETSPRLADRCDQVA